MMCAEVVSPFWCQGMTRRSMSGDRQPGLPRSTGWWPGDMMIDWVSTPRGGRMRPLSLFRPLRCLLGCSDSEAVDSVLREPAAVVVPIG